MSIRFETEDDLFVVQLSGTQHRTREVRTIRTVRIGLTLDGHSCTVIVFVTADAARTPLQEVARIDMNRRLGRHDPQAPSTLRIIQNAGFGEFPFLISVDRPTLIVTRSVTQRFVVGINIPTNSPVQMQLAS